MLTTALAVWGAVLSTLLALFEVYKWRQEGLPRVQVRGDRAWLHAPPFPERAEYFCFTAVNTGRRPLTISGCFVELRDGKRLRTDPAAGFRQPLPAKLEPGEVVNYFVPPGWITEIRTEESEIRGVLFTDAAGNEFRGPLLGCLGK